MKRKLIIALGLVIMLPVVFAVYRVIGVASYLHAQESAAREAFRMAPPGVSMSNSDNGAKRFLETGRLVLEPSYLLDPQKMKERAIFSMKLNPRVSRHGSDGWVGLYNGQWYVKIY
jgi:hypothetical protein